MLDTISQKKDWIISALIGAAAVAGGYTVSDFNSPELTELQTISNAVVDSQEAYKQKNDFYWREDWSHILIPQDGQKLTPTNLDSMPAGMKESWADVITLPDTTSFRIRVDNYESIRGKGYIIKFQKEESGLILERAIAEGPDKELYTHNWTVLNPPPVIIASSTK